MIKFEKTEVIGWEAAIRGMRNPKNSWEMSDSGHCQRDLLRDCTTCIHKSTDYPACFSGFDLGPNDHYLMMKLCNAGTDHRKFMRMITVYADITAPLYWWKEFDTYKVGTVANSCSTMHKIADKEFTLDDFSHEHLTHRSLENFEDTIEILNMYRDLYLNGGEDYFTDVDDEDYEPKDKKMWWQMIQMLPSSYNQKRTVMMNYEVLANIYKSRKDHKLDEWRGFCIWIQKLPYSELITNED